MRRVRAERTTRESSISLQLDLDGEGATSIATGLPFLDHMLDAWAHHARFDLELRAEGDLQVDDHHTVEDVALTLGSAFADALGDFGGIERFGEAFAPLDEALARAVVDLSGRPSAVVELALKRERLGTVACENLPHFFSSFASTAKVTLHLDVLRGENDHHRAEAAFKAFALACRRATRPASGGVRSTKGALVTP